MVEIIGDGRIPEAAAFYDVRDALTLQFNRDVYLCAQLAPLLGVKLIDQVIYNLEPLYDGCRSFSIGYLDVLKCNHVLDYSLPNVNYLKTHGIEAFHMPYGYHQSLERAKPAKKNIEVLFVGSVNPRRVAIFDELKKHVNFIWAKGVYGNALDDLISRSRVHVNVHFRTPHPLEVVRLNYLMANHCTVVSERGNDKEQNRLYEEGVFFYEDIIAGCLHALDHRRDGYECIKRMPQDCKPAQEWLNSR